MTRTPDPTRRRALPLCLGLLATVVPAACDRRASVPPAGPAGMPAADPPSSAPPGAPASGASP